MKRINLSLVCIVMLAICFAGCDRSDTESNGSPSIGSIYLFRDGSDPKYEYILVWGHGSTFLQKAVFPGHTDRQWYLLDEISPQDRANMARKWQIQTGNRMFPGTWFARAIFHLPMESKPVFAFHRDSDVRLGKWLETSWRSVLDKGKPIDALPAWIDQDSRIKTHLGLPPSTTTAPSNPPS